MERSEEEAKPQSMDVLTIVDTSVPATEISSNGDCVGSLESGSTSQSTASSGEDVSESSLEEDEWKQEELSKKRGVNCAGYLKRRVMFGAWKKRYFLISEGRLFEFKTNSAEKPSAVYPLKLCSISNAGDMVNRVCVISVSSPGKDALLLQAPDKSTMMLWIDAMKLVSTMVDNPGKSIQTSNSPTVIADRNGRILDINEAAKNLFGYSREELVGERVTILMFDSVARYHNQYMNNYLKSGNRKLIGILGKPRNFVARHKLEFEIPIKLVMGEFIEKGKRHFIAVFKDLRTLSTNNTLEASKSRLNIAVEKELLYISNVFRDNDARRRDLELQTQNYERKLELMKNVETELRMKICELEKLISVKPETVSAEIETNYIVSQIPTKIKSSKAGVFIDFSNVIAVEKINDGHGVAADIYQCNVDGFLCAMKIISTKNCNEKMLKHLLSEIEILESLPVHPNICRYLFHDIEGDNIRLFMTKYSASLQWKIEDLRATKKTFQPKEIAEISLKILNGLIFLHDKGIVHRDLKCDNIFCMLNEDEDVLSVAVGDFDSAKKLENKGKTVIGTPGYTAPEVLKASIDSEYDEKVDIFSFGMILYELLSLERPYYEIESVSQIAHCILTGIKPTLPLLSPDFKDLIDLHQLCINQDPKQRISPIDAKKGLLRAYW